MTAKGIPTAKTFCSDAAAMRSTNCMVWMCINNGTEKFMLGLVLVRQVHVVLVVCQGHEWEKSPLIWFTLPWRLDSSTAENIHPHTILHVVQGEELEQIIIPWRACTAGASSNLFLKSLGLSLFLSARSACISHHTRWQEQHWIPSCLVWYYQN